MNIFRATWRRVGAPSDVHKGVIPFIAIQLFALVILWFFPELVLWLPQVLYRR